MQVTPTRWSLPQCHALIFFILVIVAISTWFIPSGRFDRHTIVLPDGSSQLAVIAGSYRHVEKSTPTTDLRQGIPQILAAPMRGMIEAATVISFVLLIGGAFGVVTRTGAIERGLNALAKRLANKGILVIPITMVLMSLGGSTFGMSEETIPLYTTFIALMLALGFDSVTAVLVLYLGTQIGYVGATISPFSVLLAQSLAGIQGNPRLWLRCIAWAVFTALAIGFTLRYARRVKANPGASVMYEADRINRPLFVDVGDAATSLAFCGRDRWILSAFGIVLLTVAWGLVAKHWYMIEVGSAFLALGLFSGIVARLGPNDIANHFIDACKQFVYPAIAIGLARGILVVAQDGLIIDSVLNGLASLLHGVPKYAFTALMMLVHNVITFFVPSSSGEAALTMPVMGPLADLVGVDRDATVMAYQFGNGVTNLISPTGHVLLAALAIARIEFKQWLSVILPLFSVIWIVAAVFCAVSSYV